MLQPLSGPSIPLDPTNCASSARSRSCCNPSRVLQPLQTAGRADHRRASCMGCNPSRAPKPLPTALFALLLLKPLLSPVAPTRGYSTGNGSALPVEPPPVRSPSHLIGIPIESPGLFRRWTVEGQKVRIDSLQTQPGSLASSDDLSCDNRRTLSRVANPDGSPSLFRPMSLQRTQKVTHVLQTQPGPPATSDPIPATGRQLNLLLLQTQPGPPATSDCHPLSIASEAVSDKRFRESVFLGEPMCPYLVLFIT
jgi:hypothetical protein